MRKPARASMFVYPPLLAKQLQKRGEAHAKLHIDEKPISAHTRSALATEYMPSPGISQMTQR